MEQSDKGAARAVSIGNARLVAPTLEHILAVTGTNFELGKKAQQDAIAALYQKPKK